ncbi:MAG: MarR family transcriptional regulator [Bacteroidetes bacterium]|jgi:DNA-binding MarR family transcriptional regulator|nr:MarR family transcriptional regulator [Bacteroidota bacterium]
MKLSELIKQDQFVSPAQEAMLNIMVTNSWLTSELSAAMSPHGMTPAQYNVLRILRGSHPDRLTCSQIGDRLLDRTPDVTRLLNRLERSDLVDRRRAEYDRRVVEVGITDEGLALLGRMQEDVDEVQRHLTEHLTEEEQRQLSDLLERMRTNQNQ